MTVENLEINVKTNVTGSSAKTITNLADALEKLESKAAALTGISSIAALASAMRSLTGVSISVSSFNSLAKGIESLAAATQKISQTDIMSLQYLSSVLTAISGATQGGIDPKFLNGLSRCVEKLSASLKTITPDDIANLMMISSALRSLNGVDLSGLANATDVAKATKELGRAGREIENVGKSAKKASKGTNAFGASILRIFKYRMIRTIIKEIGQAFSEGLKNAYLFSNGLTDSGHRFAAAMDSMNSAATKMKNQMGSAFISLLTTLEPVVLRLAELATKAADAMSQLFAAFTGTTYLKAATVTDTLADDMAKGAKGAKEWKNQLLGFDVINRLEEPSGSDSGLSPSEMFGGESAPISEFWLKVAETIKRLIPDMETLKALAIGIAAALLGWKILGLVTDLSEVTGIMKKFLGVVLAVAGAFMLIQGAVDAFKNGMDLTNLLEMLAGALALTLGLGLAFGKIGAAIGMIVSGLVILAASFTDAFKNGVDWENLIGMIAGVALVTAGLALAFKTVGAGIGLVVGGVALLIAGFKDWIKTGELTTESFIAIEVGLAALGVGLTLLTKSWIPAAVAAVAMIAVAVIKYWDEISAWTKTTWENVKNWVIEANNKIEETIDKIWDSIKHYFLVTVPSIYNTVINWFKKIPEKLAFYFGEALGKLTGWGREALKWAKENVPLIINEIVNFFKELPGKLKDKMDEFHDKIIKWKDDTIRWFTENIPAIINSVIDWFEKLPDALKTIGKNMIYGLWNGVISVGNWLKEKVSNFFGGLWEDVSSMFGSFASGFSQGYESVPRYATGGFPEPGLFFANERGPELVGTINGRTAVANQDQIVEAVSQGVANAVSAVMGSGSDRPVNVRVYLDSREIKTGQRNYSRAMGV